MDFAEGNRILHSNLNILGRSAFGENNFSSMGWLKNCDFRVSFDDYWVDMGQAWVIMWVIMGAHKTHGEPCSAN